MSELDNVEVTVSLLTPQIHWENRHDTFKKVKRSRGIYMSLSDDQRTEIKEKIRGTLAVMLDRVDEWLPDSFSGDAVGESLDIQIKLVMADIDSSVAKTIETSSMKMNEATDKLSEVLEDLENEDDSRS